jgi:hypothetical protein
LKKSERLESPKGTPAFQLVDDQKINADVVGMCFALSQ